MPKKYNRNIDVIIPAYNVPDNILFRCLASIACQDIIQDVKITVVDDASTEQNYQKVIDNFKNVLDIQLLRYETNGGPGVARQYGMDHSENGYITFIDADDTFNGAFALNYLRDNLESNPTYVMCVGGFDEVFTQEDDKGNKGVFFYPHDNDMVWMFGKMYKRSFIDKYGIRFHETSRANEDNGFNTTIRLISNDIEQVAFIANHVYYWHENLNSITRQNDYQYTYGDSKRDSFYGYIENMIFAIKQAKKVNPYNGEIIKWSVDCLLNVYQHYIECYVRANDKIEKTFEYCKWYYDEIYSKIEDSISDEILAVHYNNCMKNVYLGDSFAGIIPHVSIKEFIEMLK